MSPPEGPVAVAAPQKPDIVEPSLQAEPPTIPDAKVGAAPTVVTAAPVMGAQPINISKADLDGSTDGVTIEGASDPWENRVREACDADGEIMVTVGPMAPEEVASMLTRIEEVAATVACECTMIHQHEKADKDGANPTKTAFLVVRKLPSQGHHLDLRVAVVGNVDAGKSTLVGVMTGPTSFLDDGRGLARSRVLRHKHEADTGRTSSIAEDQHMRLDAKGQCLAAERHTKGAVADPATAKVVSFIDLVRAARRHFTLSPRVSRPPARSRSVRRAPGPLERRTPRRRDTKSTSARLSTG